MILIAKILTSFLRKKPTKTTELLQQVVKLRANR